MYREKIISDYYVIYGTSKEVACELGIEGNLKGDYMVAWNNENCDYDWGFETFESKNDMFEFLKSF